mmetsp:Transcript_57759/g.183001  ORF Transcript_57759/g.183001 Transcript_57759/m.183001 type:complete len:414 (+) Transcript_57759:2827-4068(+)
MLRRQERLAQARAAGACRVRAMCSTAPIPSPAHYFVGAPPPHTPAYAPRCVGLRSESKPRALIGRGGIPGGVAPPFEAAGVSHDPITRTALPSPSVLVSVSPSSSSSYPGAGECGRPITRAISARSASTAASASSSPRRVCIENSSSFSSPPPPCCCCSKSSSAIAASLSRGGGRSPRASEGTPIGALLGSRADMAFSPHVMSSGATPLKRDGTWSDSRYSASGLSSGPGAGSRCVTSSQTSWLGWMSPRLTALMISPMWRMSWSRSTRTDSSARFSSSRAPFSRSSRSRSPRSSREAPAASSRSRLHSSRARAASASSLSARSPCSLSLASQRARSSCRSRAAAVAATTAAATSSSSRDSDRRSIGRCAPRRPPGSRRLPTRPLAASYSLLTMPRRWLYPLTRSMMASKRSL